jgi:hypothetical protein
MKTKSDRFERCYYVLITIEAGLVAWYVHMALRHPIYLAVAGCWAGAIVFNVLAIKNRRKNRRLRDREHAKLMLALLASTPEFQASVERELEQRATFAHDGVELKPGRNVYRWREFFLRTHPSYKEEK